MTGPARAPTIAPSPLPRLFRLPAPSVLRPPRFFERRLGPKRNLEGICFVLMLLLTIDVNWYVCKGNVEVKWSMSNACCFYVLTILILNV